LRDAPAEKREVLLREEVRAMLRKALGMKPDTAIPARRGFFVLGLDSLGSVQMRNELQKLLGKAFPSSLLFDYPDVESLAAYLLAGLMPEAEAVSESKSMEDAAIEGLSDEEAEQTLLRRLEQIGLS
jgi:acyl carrier protein